MIVRSERLLEDQAYLDAFMEMLRQTKHDPSLEIVILDSKYGLELKAEREIRRLFGGINPFVDFNVRLYGRERFSGVKSDAALLNRVTELMRREAGISPQEFSSRVVVVDEEEILTVAAMRRWLPMIAANGGNYQTLFEAAAKLLESDLGFEAWQRFAPDGYLIPTEQLIRSLERFRLTQIGFSRAA